MSTRLTIQLSTLAAILIGWEVLARSGLFYAEVTPSLLAIGSALAGQLLSSAFWGHAAVTIAEILVGFAVAVVLGVSVGIVLGANRYAGRMFEPYINALATTPKIIFLPIVLLAAGIGPESKAVLGALSGFFPIVLNTMAGMLQVRPVHVRVAQSFNASAWQTTRMVYLPSLVGPIITGMRLGLGVAIIGVLLGEIKLSDRGLGFLARSFYDAFRVADLYAVLLFVFCAAAAANVLMSSVERRFQSWRQA